jgi:hypothetical protein
MGLFHLAAQMSKVCPHIRLADPAGRAPAAGRAIGTFASAVGAAAVRLVAAAVGVLFRLV